MRQAKLDPLVATVQQVATRTMKPVLDRDASIAEDPLAWIEIAQPKIETKTKGLVPFVPFDFQQAILRQIAKSQSIVVDKSRQLGVSTAIMVGFTHQLLYKAQVSGTPFHCHVIANKESVAVERLLKIAKLALCTAKLEAGQRERLKGTDWRKLVPTIEYNTTYAQNYIRAHAASDTAGRSFDGNAALLEEVAFMAYAPQIWTSIAPMLDDVRDSFVALVSTYNGDGDFFCDCVDNADEMGLFHLPLDWRAHPSRDKNWEKRSRRRFVGRLAEWEEEHNLKRMRSGEQIFDVILIGDLARDEPFLGHDTDTALPIPIPSHRYSKGVDIAGKGRDYTVHTVIDLSGRPPQVVYQRRLGAQSTGEKVASIERLDETFPGPLFIDGTTDPAIAALVKALNKIAIQITGGSQITHKTDRAEGLRWQNVPRDRMLSWLAADLETGSLLCHLDHFPELYSALKTARRLASQKRMGKFPDYLDSLMLANLGLTRRERKGYTEDNLIGGVPSHERLDQLRHPQGRW